MMWLAASRSVVAARHRLSACLAGLGAIAVLASCTSQKLDDGYDKWLANETKVAETRAKALYRVHLSELAGNSLQMTAEMASGPSDLARRISTQRDLLTRVLPETLSRNHETTQIFRANFKRAAEIAVESNLRTIPNIITDKAELEALYKSAKSHAVQQLETLISFCANGPSFGLPAPTNPPTRIQKASASRPFTPSDRLKAFSQYAHFARTELMLVTGDGAILMTSLIANRSRPAMSGLTHIARGDFPRTVAQYKKACEPDLELFRSALEKLQTGSPIEIEDKVQAMRGTLEMDWAESAGPRLQLALRAATPELMAEKTGEELDQIDERTLATLAVHSILATYVESLHGPIALASAVPNDAPITNLQAELTKIANAVPAAQAALDGFLAAVPNVPVSAFNGATHRYLAATPLDLDLSMIIGEGLYARLTERGVALQEVGVKLAQWRERAAQSASSVGPNLALGSERFFELLVKRP